MEKRKLGRTGLETSILGYGAFHLLEILYRDAESLLNSYLDAGGNYIDTALCYGDGESERKIGKAVSRRRSEYILASKSDSRDKKGFLSDLNRSLEHLNTDYIDVMIMHAVGKPEALRSILGPEGALEGFFSAKRQGKVGHVGISVHGQADILIEALRQYPFDVVMSSINYYDRFNFPEIEEELYPLAKKEEAAIVLMKPIADGFLWRSAPQAFRYAFSQPVSVVLAGINTPEMLEADLRYASEFVPMSDSEKEELYRTAPELGNYVCRQCGNCQPCPEGLSIREIFRLEGCFDRQMLTGTVKDPGDYALRKRLRYWYAISQRAVDRYEQLEVKADRCTGCNACTPKCPYSIDIVRKLEMVDYKIRMYGKDYY